MYPLNLEHQYERFLAREFDEFARRVARNLMPKIASAVHSDVAVSSGRSDAPDEDIYVFMGKLREESGDWIDREVLQAKISRHFHLIDAWSRDKVIESVERLATRLSTPQGPSVTRRPSPPGTGGEKWLTTIDLLGRDSGMAKTQLDRIIKTNLSLIRSLQAEHFEEVQRIVGDGLAGGAGYKSMTDAIERATGVNRNRARFWARDQASKFFGEVTKTRQTAAGIPGYVWRTVRDGRVRDAHSAVSGKYFTWAKPPNAGVRGNAVHPGEDFKCRCWAEPAFGPEYADIPEKAPRDPLAYMKPAGIVNAFTPAGSIREAERYVQSLGIAEHVSYSGIPLKTVNTINKALFDLKQRYPYLRPVSVTETKSASSSAKGNYKRLILNKRHFFSREQNADVMEEWHRETLNAELRRAQEVYARSEKAGNETLKRAAAKALADARYLTGFSRGVVSVKGKEYESVIYHEYGHIVSDQTYGMLNGKTASPLAYSAMITMFNEEWRQIYLQLKNSNDIFRVSAYALKNERECLSECFTMYHLEPGKVPEYVRNFIRKYFDNFTPMP